MEGERYPLPEAEGTLEPLAAGTNLHRRYTVRGVLRADECQTCYDGFDYKARQGVVILEFFPRQLALRAANAPAVSPKNRGCGELFFLGSEAFLSQYGALTQALGSPNIVSVFDAFFENGTAYAVTERLDGLSLEAYLEMQGRRLSDGELAYLLQALANALLVVHSLNILHHDISARNILLCTDGTVKLTDFGAARRTIRTRRTVDGADPAADIRALGRALERAYADKPAGRPLSGLLERMTADEPAPGFLSVFELLHALGTLDVRPVRPEVTEARLSEYEAWRARQAEQRERMLEERRRQERERTEAEQRERERLEAEQAARRRKKLLGVCAILAGVGVIVALLVRLIWFH